MHESNDNNMQDSMKSNENFENSYLQNAEKNKTNPEKKSKFANQNGNSNYTHEKQE